MPRDSAVTDDRLEFHLWNWENWQRRSRFWSFRRLWYPGRASGGMGNSGSIDFDAMVAHVDTRCAKAVEAALNNCAPAERCAVHHKHLDAVYRFRLPLDVLYAAALARIADHLTRAGIV